MTITRIETYKLVTPSGDLTLTESEARELLHDLAELFGPRTEPRRLSGIEVAHATRRQELPDYDPAPSIARESKLRDGCIGHGADVVVLKPGEPPQEPDELDKARRAFGVGRKLHPTSQALIDEIGTGSGDAEELSSRLGWPEWKVSQTAKTLIRRGLLRANKRGKRLVYLLPEGAQT
jgi:hypothetical protein